MRLIWADNSIKTRWSVSPEHMRATASAHSAKSRAFLDRNPVRRSSIASTRHSLVLWQKNTLLGLTFSPEPSRLIWFGVASWMCPNPRVAWMFSRTGRSSRRKEMEKRAWAWCSLADRKKHPSPSVSPENHANQFASTSGIAVSGALSRCRHAFEQYVCRRASFCGRSVSLPQNAQMNVPTYGGLVRGFVSRQTREQYRWGNFIPSLPHFRQRPVNACFAWAYHTACRHALLHVVAPGDCGRTLSVKTLPQRTHSRSVSAFAIPSFGSQPTIDCSTLPGGMHTQWGTHRAPGDT